MSKARYPLTDDSIMKCTQCGYLEPWVIERLRISRNNCCPECGSTTVPIEPIEEKPEPAIPS